MDFERLQSEGHGELTAPGRADNDGSERASEFKRSVRRGARRGGGDSLVAKMARV